MVSFSVAGSETISCAIGCAVSPRVDEVAEGEVRAGEADAWVVDAA